MPARTKTLIAAIGITALAIVGLDTYTYAGTGDSLILGKLNKSSKTTHVTSTGKGPALSLHAKGNRPALAVDSKAKIVKLNADLVDGRDATALQNNVRVYTKTSGGTSSGNMTLELPQVPAGRYQVGYEVMMFDAYGSISNPTIAKCYLRELDSQRRFAAYTSTTVEGLNVGLSGNGVIVKDGDAWTLQCSAYQLGIGDDDWSIEPDAPIRVTLTRIDKTIGGPLDVARAAGGKVR